MLKFNKESKGKDALGISGDKKKKKVTTKDGPGRKMYESKKDLSNESDIAERLSHYFKAAFDKMPLSYGLDFMVTKNDKVIGVCEVKRRHMAHDKYPSFMISLLKFNKGLDFHYRNGIRFSLAIQFDDGVYRYVYKEGDMDKIKIEFSGRTTQTRDSADLEPVVQIPVSMFQKVPLK